MNEFDYKKLKRQGTLNPYNMNRTLVNKNILQNCCFAVLQLFMVDLKEWKIFIK